MNGGIFIAGLHGIFSSCMELDCYADFMFVGTCCIVPSVSSIFKPGAPSYRAWFY
jgi:hypothetical protein